MPVTKPASKKNLNLWKHRDFMMLWLGQATSQFGAQIGGLATPVVAVSLLAATDFQVGVLNAMQTAAFLLVGLPAGVWIDHWRKRKVMILADLIRAIALLTIPILWVVGSLNIWDLIAVAAVLGTASVFFDLGYYSFVPILLPKRAMTDANGKLEATAQIARISGPAISGGLMALIAAPMVLFSTSLTYAVSFISLLFVRDDELSIKRTKSKKLTQEISEGMRFIGKQPLLIAVISGASVNGLFSTMVQTLTPILILRDVGLSATLMGLAITIGAFGGLIGAALTSRIQARLGEGRTLAVAQCLTVLFGVLMPILSLFPQGGFAFYVATIFISSFFALIWNITQLTFRQKLTPVRLLGRVNASFRFIVWGVMPIGSILAGLLSTWLGLSATMWIAWVGTLFSIIPMWRSGMFKVGDLPQLDTGLIDVVPTMPTPLAATTGSINLPPAS